MKELESNPKEKTEISIQKKKQVEKQLVGVLKPHSGHNIFEIDLETLDVKYAQFVNYTFSIGKNHTNKELLVREGCVYVCALNKNNALKKYLKGSNGSKEAKNPIKLSKYGF